MKKTNKTITATAWEALLAHGFQGVQTVNGPAFTEADWIEKGNALADYPHTFRLDTDTHSFMHPCIKRVDAEGTVRHAWELIAKSEDEESSEEDDLPDAGYQLRLTYWIYMAKPGKVEKFTRVMPVCEEEPATESQAPGIIAVRETVTREVTHLTQSGACRVEFELYVWDGAKYVSTRSYKRI